MRTLQSGAAIAALTLVLTACGNADGGSETTQEDDPLTIALPAPNAVYWSIYVAMEKGWFEEEGFSPELVSAQGSAGAVQQVAAGSAQIGAATPDAVVNAVVGGAEVKMLSACLLATPLTLVGQPEVESYGDLQGQILGVSALKGGEITFLRMLLDQNGLVEGDYEIVVAGTTPAKAAALQADSVAAAVLFSPADFTLLREGFSRVGSTSEVPLAEEVPLAVYSVQDEWISEDDNGMRLRTALERANTWLADPANKEEAVEIFAEASEQPAEDLASTYELWFEQEQIWPDGAGQVTDEQVEATLEMMRQNDDLDGAGPAVDELRVP